MSVRDPLFLPALGFITGICASEWAGVAPGEGACIALCAIACLALSRAKELRFSAAISLFVLFAALGAVRLATTPSLNPPRINVAAGERAIVQGCVVEPAVAAGDRTRFVVEIAPGTRLRVSAEPTRWLPSYGDRVRGTAQIQEPSEFRNPGAFSYRGWLARRSVFWVATSAKGEAWTRIGTGCAPIWRAVIYRARSNLLERLDRLYANDRYHSAMMRGLLLGDASSIEKVWVEDFRRTGTYHALVISGGHVAFFTGLFLLWIRLSRLGWRGVLVLAAVTAWLYALLAGGEPPVIRSAAGFTFYVISRFFYRRARLLNLLSLVALLFLAFEPRQLFEASFQLSFLAVAAIAALAEPLTERHLQPLALIAGHLRKLDTQHRILNDPRLAGVLVELQLISRTIAATTRLPEPAVRKTIAWALQLLRWIATSLLVSGCVQLALALPMVLYFHRVSWTGLTANLVVTPAVTLAVPLGFLAIATGSTWLAMLAGCLLDASRWLAALHATWEFDFRVPDPPLWLSLALIAASALWAWLVRRRSRWTLPGFALAAATLAAIAIAPLPPRLQPGALEFTAIDVGNGDSLFLGLPGGSAVVIDSGGLPSRPGVPARIDTGEDVVSPYLWARGIRRLEALAVTHLDNDHSGGMDALLRNFRPREFWTGSLPDTPRAARLLQTARDCGATIVRLHPGQRFSRGGASWVVVAAEDAGALRENDTSLVFRVEYGRQSLLLTGDLERPGELRVLDRGALSPATVLKVSHHGSRTGTSAEFLDALRPAIAVISAGRHNLYGFPHRPVLESLEEHRVQIFRTDLSGAIGLRTNGQSWERLEPGVSPQARFNPFGAVD